MPDFPFLQLQSSEPFCNKFEMLADQMQNAFYQMLFIAT